MYCVVRSNFHGSERLRLKAELVRFLGQARLLGRDVAPLLDDGLLDLPGVGSGPGADLLGHVHTLLSWAELGDRLGDVLTGPLGLQGTLLLGGVLDDSLDLVVTLLISLCEPTASGGAELPGLLGAAGDGGVLLHILLGDAAHLPGPLGALGVGGVAGGLVLALLLHLSPALHHVVLHVVNLLLGPTLGLVLSPADLGSLDVTVLHQGSPADLHRLVEGDLLVIDEAALPEVLLALLLLLWLVVGDVGGVAPLVVAVVALHVVFVLDHLHHLHLVDTSLTVIVGSDGYHVIDIGRAIDYCERLTLTLTLVSHARGERVAKPMNTAVLMVATMMVLVSLSIIEGEGVRQRLRISSQIFFQGKGGSQESEENKLVHPGAWRWLRSKFGLA